MAIKYFGYIVSNCVKNIILNQIGADWYQKLISKYCFYPPLGELCITGVPQGIPTRHELKLAHLCDNKIENKKPRCVRSGTNATSVPSHQKRLLRLIFKILLVSPPWRTVNFRGSPRNPYPSWPQISSSMWRQNRK